MPLIDKKISELDPASALELLMTSELAIAPIGHPQTLRVSLELIANLIGGEKTFMAATDPLLEIGRDKDNWLNTAVGSFWKKDVTNWVKKYQFTPGTGGTGSNVDQSFETILYAASRTVAYNPLRPKKKITLTGDIQVTNTGTVNGSQGIYLFKQGSAGNFKATINGTLQTLNPAPASFTAIAWMYDGTDYHYDSNYINASDMDLADYYNKIEVDNLLQNISAGALIPYTWEVVPSDLPYNTLKKTNPNFITHLYWNGAPQYDGVDFVATPNESGGVTITGLEPIYSGNGFVKYIPLGELDVVEPENISPVANAGTDQNIATGVTIATLNGSGSDADGSIASYIWTKISGGGTIINPNSANTGVTGLTEGINTFRLTVTDNQGATHFDEVAITVAAAGGSITPDAPTFTNVNLTNKTVELVPKNGIPFSDYRYTIGTDPTVHEIPLNGVIDWTLVGSYINAYSIPSEGRYQSANGIFNPNIFHAEFNTNNPTPLTEYLPEIGDIDVIQGSGVVLNGGGISNTTTEGERLRFTFDPSTHFQETFIHFSNVGNPASEVGNDSVYIVYDYVDALNWKAFNFSTVGDGIVYFKTSSFVNGVYTESDPGYAQSNGAPLYSFGMRFIPDPGGVRMFISMDNGAPLDSADVSRQTISGPFTSTKMAIFIEKANAIVIDYIRVLPIPE